MTAVTHTDGRKVLISVTEKERGRGEVVMETLVSLNQLPVL